MDYWFETEIRARRDEVIASVIRSRNVRLAESGRSTGFRARRADGAQVMSDRLARLALALRGTERA